MSSVKHGPFPDPKWVRVKWSQRLGPRRFAPTSQGAISWHSYNNPATEALRLGPFSEIFRQVTSIVILSNHPYLLHRSGDYFFGYSLEQNCIYTHYIYIQMIIYFLELLPSRVLFGVHILGCPPPLQVPVTT